MKKLSMLICAVLCGTFLFAGCVPVSAKAEHLPDTKFAEPVLGESEPIVQMVTVPVKCAGSEPTAISEDDIALMALMTMAEAESESDYGKRLVIDTILNRVDSEHYPDTVYDVIYQPNQFSPVWNGRLNRCEVQEDICRLVREELESRTNYDVMFFRTERYSAYGQPLFQVERHYFSSYN